MSDTANLCLLKTIKRHGQLLLARLFYAKEP